MWGSNPWTVRSWPEPKLDAQPTEPPKCPYISWILIRKQKSKLVLLCWTFHCNLYLLYFKRREIFNRNHTKRMFSPIKILNAMGIQRNSSLSRYVSGVVMWQELLSLHTGSQVFPQNTSALTEVHGMHSNKEDFIWTYMRGTVMSWMMTSKKI